MSEIDQDEMLDVIQKRRAAEEVRRNAVKCLMPRSIRNVPAAIIYIATAIGVTVANVWMGVEFEGGSDHSSFLLLAMTMWSFYMGLASLIPNPRDRLLLLLAQEAVLRCDEAPLGKEPETSSQEEL